MPNDSLNKGWVYRNRIQPDAHGQTVLDFYTTRYPHSTRKDWQGRIESARITLDGLPTSPETRLATGQELAYAREPWSEPAAPGAFGVLYRDEHVLAVAKPSGLPVLPGGEHLENTLLSHVRRRYGEAPAPIHRLGRGTSGVVLFARSGLAKRRLSEDLARGRLTKVYRALAAGTDMDDCFTVDTPIGRVPYPDIRYVYAADPNGKPSRSQCRVLRRDPEGACTLLEVRILTGRPHQIRIHLASAGHPLVGDPLYGPGGLPLPVVPGARLPLPGDVGYHLHSHVVNFSHPESGGTVTVICHPPPVLRTPTD